MPVLSAPFAGLMGRLLESASVHKDRTALVFGHESLTYDALIRRVDTLAGALHAESGVAVSVRCGVAAGDPIEERGDLFGLAVARAARICSLAEGGTVLVSDEIPPMAAGGGLRFEDRGAVELRGIPGARPVLAAFEDQR